MWFSNLKAVFISMKRYDFSKKECGTDASRDLSGRCELIGFSELGR